MSCPFRSACPSCCRMLAYDDELGAGLCQGAYDRCARFQVYRSGEPVPVTLLPGGANLAVHGRWSGQEPLAEDRHAAILGGGLIGGALRVVVRAATGF